MRSTDYKDLVGGSEKTDRTPETAAANAAHVARLLAKEPYPA
jgi:hypothetical protein